MKIIKDQIKIHELKQMSEKMFGNLVKGVIDIKKEILAVDAEMHVDLEKELLEKGSTQNDLWGINLYYDLFGTADFLEFDSIINIRPWQNNKIRGIEDKNIQNKIINIVEKMVIK